MLTKSGAKLLDFSLSKLQPTPDLIALSTIGSEPAPLTAQGAVLGTLPYMAPEQLEGRETDARTDIFAFGAIVYEMATGERAFQGATAASLIGAILHTDPPPVSTLQPLTPPGLDHIVARCLAKNPDDRWQTARDLVLELKGISEHASRPVERKTRPNKSVRQLGAALLAVLAIGAGAFALGIYLRPRVNEPAVRITFAPPTGLTLAEVRATGPVTISPDGTRVVYVAAAKDGPQRLWIQPLDSTTAQALAGTDAAAYPFWSPDGRSIGFFANGKLKRIDAAGGPVHGLCDVVLPRGGTWSHAGVIVFSAGAGEHLYQVSSGGGEPATLTFINPNRESLWPSFLADGRRFVFFGRREDPGIYAASLDPAVPARRLAKGTYAGAAYASDGYLMFGTGGAMGVTLFAQPIDLGGLLLTGEPIPLAERVPFYPRLGLLDFSVSKNGRLIHGNQTDDATSLVWFDRAGNPLVTVPGASGYQRPILSPDDKWIGAHRLNPESQSSDVYLIDSTRGVTSRLTTNPGLDNMGLWSPDGRHILYGSTREDQGTNSYVKAVAGTEAETPIFTSGFRALQQMTDWSGKLFVFGREDPKTQWDLWTMPETGTPADATTAPALYLQTEFNEHEGVLSPDGRWMAYTSDQSGRQEVYVDAFPRRVRRTPVSTTGGKWPQWGRGGKELFYLSLDQTLMAVTVQTSTGFEASAPRALFKLQMRDRGAPSDRTYSPARDGQRFLVNVSPEAAPSPISVLLNWPAALRR